MANVPQTNTPATDFALPNGDAQPVKLSNFRGKNGDTRRDRGIDANAAMS